MKKTLLGLAFIALAVLVLLKETLGLGALPFWPLIWTAVFVGLTLKSLFQKHWYHGILFGLLTLVMLNSIYHWVEVSFWTLVLVGGLLLFGFNLLFAPSQNAFFWKGLKRCRAACFWSCFARSGPCLCEWDPLCDG